MTLKNEKRHVIPSTPEDSKEAANLQICKQLGLGGLPPEIPSKGLAVPELTLIYATKLRKLIRLDPENVPIFLHVWKAKYENAHPYGFAKSEVLEDRWNAENAARLAESPEVEEAKGNKTFKIMDAVGNLVRAGGATYKDAFEVVLAAFEAGSKVAIEAMTSSRKGRENEEAQTFASLRGVIDDLSKNLRETINITATERRELHLERKDLYTEHEEILQLLKDASDGKKIEITKDRAGLLWGGLKQVMGLFAPMLKEKGFDIGPLLQNSEQPALESAGQDENEEESGDDEK